MPIEVTATAHGSAAFDALAVAVRRAKRGDPLVPVTVIVPTNSAGVMARRALGRRGGATAIDVLTLFRVAELLGSPSLLARGRKPVSTPVVDLAVKQVLTRSPGLYGPVHRHPSTVVALRDLYRELRVAGPTALTALARTARGNEPARVAAEVARLLAPSWYDEGDLLAAAASATRRQLPDRLSRVVVHLPERLRPLEQQLLRALATTADVELIVGVTGHPDADEPIEAFIADLTGDAAAASVPSPRSGLVDVISTTDADDEVRLAVRAVVDGARRGTRFDRMAVLWPTRRPYARMVEHQLTAARIPWNGRPGTGTDERMVPRLLADLLELDRRGLRRSALMTLLGDVPARDADGRPVPSVRWERIGRRAGVVRDADWEVRLSQAIIDAAERGPTEVAAAAGLKAFVDDLRSALGAPSDVRRWSEWVAWSHERLDWWFGRRGLDRLEGVERDAWERTQLVLTRLGHLDSIGPPVTRAEFRATFVAELEVAPARHGKVGDGVHVGALAGAGGLDIDLVVVIGAADGLLPPPPEVDPLLGDAERVAAGLVGSDERVTAAHRQFLAAVGTTPVSLVTVPRGDLRASADNQPSRWLEALGGATIRTWTTVHSHAHALASTVFPVSAAEHRQRHLWTHVRAGGDVRDFGASDAILGRALQLRDARAGDVLSQYDGDLSSRTMPRVTGPVSATRIELWPRCPHAYFVRYVLGVRPIDEPEEIETLSALDRGSAMHAAIDRLQQEVLSGRLPDPSPHGWTDVHRDALARIGTAVAEELEAGGRTGRDASWANERAALLAELDRWMDADAAQWHGRRILHSELRFGEDGEVRLVLPDGRLLSFSGQVDRIDELPDGTLVVTDHKTGRADSLSKLSAEAPTMGATRFQLPVYAAAAMQTHGRPRGPVRAEYSFFERGDFKRIGYSLDDRIWAQVREDLALVVDGIEAGYFPARAEPPAWRPFVDCEYCEPDGLGTAVRWAEWERKRHDPRLARWFGDPDEAASDAQGGGGGSSGVC